MCLADEDVWGLRLSEPWARHHVPFGGPFTRVPYYFGDVEGDPNLGSTKLLVGNGGMDPDELGPP